MTFYVIVCGCVVNFQRQIMKKQDKIDAAIVGLQKEEIAILRGIIERLLPSQIAPQKTS